MASQAFASREGAPDVQTPRWAWWLLLLVALCTFAVGVLLLFWPHRTLSTLAVIVGIYLLAVGALWVGVSLGVKEVRGVGLWRGALALLAGVILVRHPSDSITILALAFGIFLLLAGVFELVAAIELPDRSRETPASGGNPRFGQRGWRILEGLVDLAIGILIVSWPQFGVYTFAVVLGISLIVRGAVEACLAVAGMAVARDERHGHTDLSVA
jgi:uncharacterized membrane protein HdeD (DUF308 family)